ncbi:MAG: PucR family transcriptional regulator, partial [Solirubrobacteraceae bacterium]
GRSGVRHGAGQARDGLREAADAARVAAATLDSGGVLAYGSLGAYRYLVQLVAQDAPPDPYLEAVRKIADYDRRRRSQLVTTLEEYLLHRRRINETARTLVVHPNTLRQRLERIETLTGLDLNRADLLALEMAIKLARLKAPSL